MQNAKIGIFVVFLQSATGNIMNLGLRQIFTILAALLLAINVPAQDIPLLPQDPAVVSGLTPNGMAYYLVTNPAEKGLADFAIVQKAGRLTFPDSTGCRAETLAEDALSSLKRIRPESAACFFIRKGTYPKAEGFAEVTDDATVFRFSGVALNTVAVDSVLLVLMDIADRADYAGDDILKKWYAPADQAVVISGDIDSKAIAAKLHSMSYMIPARESATRPEYVRRNSGPVPVIETYGDITRISATWTSERAPREYMNTVQSEIFEMSLNTLGAAAVNRIRAELKAAGIPAADVSYGHVCSSTHPYDDSITITLAVGSEDASEASGILAETMASIKMHGIRLNEYRIAESAYIQKLTDASENPLTFNSDYVDMCVNAFLYNAPMSSPKERLAFQTAGNLPDTMRLRLFNGIARAVIDSVWSGPEPEPCGDVALPDTLFGPSAAIKVKLKSSKREPVSRGVIWTFSNGFKVIYKKMASDRMYYALALNGGYGSVREFHEGEGAFLSDYLKTCRVRGLEVERFMEILGTQGVTMDMNVNMSNTMVSGSFHADNMTLLLRSLIAMANEMTPDEASFDYWKKSEYLALDMMKGSLYARMTAVDSIICPGYRYSSYKTKDRLSPEFQARAGAFYESQFSKMNDGALIIAGDMDEDRLKKVLLAYVGEFRTSGGLAPKPSVHYQAVSGTSTYTVKGESDNVDVVMSSRLPVTMENYIAAEFASEVLRAELAEEMHGSGMDASVTHECWIYPEERINVLVSVPGASMNALSVLRSVLSGLDGMEVSEERLNAWKETLKHRISLEMTSPAYWVDAIALRYLIGKDLSTNYAAKIDAVTAEKVKSVLSVMDDGCKVEYVTIKE